MSGYFGALNFGEDGAVVFEKGWIEDDPLRYTGTFDLSAAAELHFKRFLAITFR